MEQYKAGKRDSHEAGNRTSVCIRHSGNTPEDLSDFNQTDNLLGPGFQVLCSPAAARSSGSVVPMGCSGRG